MKNDNSNLWKDIFGYHDQDFDGDIDLDDVLLEDDIYDAVDVELNRKTDLDYFDDDEDDDDDDD